MTRGTYPGARVGSFRLERPAGQGRRPGVWRGRDIRSGRPVAIEVLGRWPGRDQVACASFGERLAAIAQLRHASIAAVLDYGFEDEAAYVVSAWVGSTTLASLAQRRAARPSSVRLMLGPLASALAVAHDAGVPHLDVRSGSVALDPRHRPHLTDFLPSGPPLRREVAEVVGAPPASWSPELSSAGTADAAADAYGLGLLLYELVAGDPAPAGDRESQARRRLDEDLPPLAEAAPRLARTDASLCTLCDELMGRNPWTRPTLADAAELLLAPPIGRARVRQRALAVRAAEFGPRPFQPVRAESRVTPVPAKAGGRAGPSSPPRRGADAQPRPRVRAPRRDQTHEDETEDRRRPATALGILGTVCVLALILVRASRESRRDPATRINATHP